MATLPYRFPFLSFVDASVYPPYVTPRVYLLVPNQRQTAPRGGNLGVKKEIKYLQFSSGGSVHPAELREGFPAVMFDDENGIVVINSVGLELHKVFSIKPLS